VGKLLLPYNRIQEFTPSGKTKIRGRAMLVDENQKNKEVANQFYIALVLAEICEREGIPYTRKLKKILDQLKYK
jgi:hypothetical protein